MADDDDDRAATLAMAGHLRSAMVVLMVDLGHRLGLFEALAAADGPLTAGQLAGAAGCDERNVQEWLGAVTTGGLVLLDPAADTYALAPGFAAVLTGTGPGNLAPQAATVAALAPVLPRVVQAVRDGAGVGYEAYRPAFTTSMDQGSRAVFDHALIDGHIAAVPGLADRLRAGARVLDVGCGTGHAANLLAAAFPASQVLGLDLGADAVAAARAEAEGAGLKNVRFQVADVLDLPIDPGWDLVTAFDAVHDQADPAGLLARIASALTPGGTFLMVDIKAETGVAANLRHPMGPWLYGISTLHCLQVSLAGGGPGLGTCWGREQALAMLAAAGFADVTVHKVDGDRANLLYACHRR